MNAILMFLRATDIRLRCVRCMPKIAAAVFEVERVSSNGGHAHIQAVPVPLRLESRLESAFLDGGKLQGIEFDVEEAGARSGDHGEAIFGWNCLTGEDLCIGLPLSVWFGRYAAKSILMVLSSLMDKFTVLASLLKMEDRADWKSCLQSEEEDKADVQAFKAVFAPFDPLR